MFNMLLALALATATTPAPTAHAAQVRDFMVRMEAIAKVAEPRRTELIEKEYGALATIDPRAVADTDLEAMLAASMTAAGLAHAPDIATHTRALFEEMRTRDLLERSDYRYMQQLYVSLRSFDQARRFHDAYGTALTLDTIPRIAITPGFNPAARSILVPTVENGLRQENFDTGRASFVLVVADPLCHFTLDAVAAIESDSQLKAYFSRHSRWMAPDGVKLDLELLGKWNAAFPAYPLAFVDDRNTWRDIGYWGTPTFYVFENGTMVHSIRGWPVGGRTGELKAALGIRTQTGP